MNENSKTITPEKKLDDDRKDVAAQHKNEGLVKVKKGDAELHVHPTTLHDHEKAGWKAEK